MESCEDAAESFVEASAVFGLGGGQAMDMAKYVHWKRKNPLVLIPTVLSADAAYTKAIAVRVDGKVTYVGSALADHLLIDFDVLRAGPPELNKAGAGDILSIFTALADWEEAHKRLGEFHDSQIAKAAGELLAGLLAGARELATLSDEGLRLLSESFLGEVRLGEMVGNSRPEEGSEHHLAYCIESITHRPFIHGQLVELCTLIAARLQGQDATPILRFLNQVEASCHPDTVGLSRDELRTALLRVGQYVRSDPSLLPGHFHFRPPLAEREVEALLAWVYEVTE
jgi:glycerol-1-phosphate dehydrogenase [NAD(P)+]